MPRHTDNHWLELLGNGSSNVANVLQKDLSLDGTADNGEANVQSTLTTALTGTNNDLTYVAVARGTAGDALSVEYIDPAGNNATLAAALVAGVLTVDLATDGGGAITTTSGDIVTLLSTAEFSGSFTVANAAANDGTGVVTALAETSFAGGVDNAIPLFRVTGTVLATAFLINTSLLSSATPGGAWLRLGTELDGNYFFDDTGALQDQIIGSVFAVGGIGTDIPTTLVKPLLATDVVLFPSSGSVVTVGEDVTGDLQCYILWRPLSKDATVTVL